jgi:hypothetical protein
MKVISNIAIRVATLSGAIINIKANEARELSKEIAIQALQMGATVVTNEAPDLPEPVKEPARFIADTEDDAALANVIAKLVEENDPQNFKVDNSPKAAVINEIMGRVITANERDAAWNTYLNS